LPPQVSFVGLTEEAAREVAEKEGYADKVSVAKTSFKANSKVRRQPLGKLHVSLAPFDWLR
jgi:pyruvate/2-oxoglutarate dehydrogenase complex dihydrolipoamide dehydrogenase (E3) component